MTGASPDGSRNCKTMYLAFAKTSPSARSAGKITFLVVISMALGIPATAQDFAYEVSLGGATGDYGTDTPVTSIIILPEIMHG